MRSLLIFGMLLLILTSCDPSTRWRIAVKNNSSYRLHVIYTPENEPWLQAAGKQATRAVASGSTVTLYKWKELGTPAHFREYDFDAKVKSLGVIRLDKDKNVVEYVPYPANKEKWTYSREVEQTESSGEQKVSIYTLVISDSSLIPADSSNKGI